MRITPQSDMTTVVLLGAFNPSMFHPSWFAAQKAIGPQEAKDAEIAILHPQIASFKTSKLQVEVQNNKFIVASDVLPEATQDLVVTIFGGPLVGTPIFALGINRSIHFDVGSSKVQHAIGRSLAPTGPWGDWGKTLDEEDHQSAARGGLMSLQLQGARKSGPKGYVQVRLEPSAMIRGTGIFMEINNHYNLVADPPEAADASAMIETIKGEWDGANKTAERIVDQIMSLANEEAGA